MIFYYILASIGMCFIMKYGSILESFRRKTSSWIPCLEKLYKCCLCMGFWAGVITGSCLYTAEDWTFPEMLFYPFITSAICWYADSSMNLINAKANYFNSGSSISSSSGSSSSTPNK